jgi:hypothetical protein
MVRNHAEQIRGKVRMVVNYKKLNDETIFYGYYLPHKESLINQIFSKFDCKSRFWQIKMHKDNIPLIVFSTLQGQYEWLVLPFELKNAPKIFQRKLDNILKFYLFSYVYVNDVLIASSFISEQLDHLNIFADIRLWHGLCLSKKKKKAKIRFFGIEFLGFKINPQGIELQPHIVDKIN